MLASILAVVLWPAVGALATYFAQRYFHAQLEAGKVDQEHKDALDTVAKAVSVVRQEALTLAEGLRTRVDALEKTNFELGRQANLQKVFQAKK